MRAAASLCFLVVLFTGAALAAPAYTATCNSTGAGTGTNTVTISSTAAGHVLAVVVTVDDTGDQSPTVSDNKSGGSSTYTQIGTQSKEFTGFTSQLAYYVENSASGITSV